MAHDPHRRQLRPQDERFLRSDYGITDLGGIHIESQELSELIEDHGTGAELRRAQVCPCIRPETLGPRGSCPSCKGLRWLHPESARESVIALMQGQQLQRLALAGGELVTGTVKFSFPLGIIPGEGDMILPEGEVHVVHETLWRNDQPVRPSRMRSRVTTSDNQPLRLPPRRERLLYPDVLTVETVWYWDDDAGAEGEAVQATQGHDFGPPRAGVIPWFPGRGPAGGKAYTVRYTAPAAYMLLPAEPAYRNEAGDSYPYSAIGNRLDRWGSPDFERTKAPA